jgi:hypothetical protein
MATMVETPLGSIATTELGPPLMLDHIRSRSLEVQGCVAVEVPLWLVSLE